MRGGQGYNISWQPCLRALPLGLGQILKAGLSLHLQCPAKALSNELISSAAYSFQPEAGMWYINHPQPHVADAPLKPII